MFNPVNNQNIGWWKYVHRMEVENTVLLRYTIFWLGFCGHLRWLEGKLLWANFLTQIVNRTKWISRYKGTNNYAYSTMYASALTVSMSYWRSPPSSGNWNQRRYEKWKQFNATIYHQFTSVKSAQLMDRALSNDLLMPLLLRFVRKHLRQKLEYFRYQKIKSLHHYSNLHCFKFPTGFEQFLSQAWEDGQVTRSYKISKLLRSRPPKDQHL
jgi:hypothetical protein